MFQPALFFLAITVLAAIFGFGGVAAAVIADLAQVLFYVAAIMFVLLFLTGLVMGSSLW